MLNRYLLSGCLIGSTMAMVSSPAIAQQALSPRKVAKIAKSTVVQIAPTVNYPGSGVIIGSYKENGKNVYVVLTAKHVVEHKDDEYQVITPVPVKGDRRRQKIKISTQNDIQRLAGVDLAIVKFRSKHEFKTATLGNSDHTTEGSGIYVSGFPNPGQAIRRRIFQFTSSLVSSRLDGDVVAGEEDTVVVDNGYAISYTATTRAGMSGGPVFDVAGRVVGIHGRGDREETRKLPTSQKRTQESGPILVPNKTGFNLAIPSQTFFRKLKPSAIYVLGMNYDKSEPGETQLYATRGGKPVDPRDPLGTNIIEEEPVDAVVEEVNESTQNRNPSLRIDSQIRPEGTPSRQPKRPTPPTPPTPPTQLKTIPSQNTNPVPSGNRIW